MKHILQGDNAQRASVFVRDDGKMLFRMAQLRQHLWELHRLVYVEWFHQQAAYGD